MSLVVNTNVASLTAQRFLGNATGALNANLGHLASGLRIATAGDDASGLGISERMRASIRSQGAALRNLEDGISLAQTAEGALNEVHGMLSRLRELAVQSLNGTNGAQDRAQLEQEARTIVTELDRVARSTEFNGKKLLDGTANGLALQVGVEQGDTITLALTSASSTALGVRAVHVDTVARAQSALASVDTAIQRVSTLRGTLGATTNRLQSAYASTQVARENLSASESRIRDVDVAAETSELVKHGILQQSALAMLQQANVQPALALVLLSPQNN
ncbi:MAG: flagellin FliC [Chloroflexi bacterium]|nr:flagellin FliC [Chloroflexota bacterium]